MVVTGGEFGVLMKTLSRLGAVVLGFAALGMLVVGLSLEPPGQRTTLGQKPKPGNLQLSGSPARVYLEQNSGGQSLGRALEVARFGLQWQDQAPDGVEMGGGYLGMSHEQNLRAWFGQDGVTVRPTLPPDKSDQAWASALHLKAWGYGKQLTDVPPIVSRKVRENRIEYERAFPNPNSKIQNLKLAEWYENRAEGIEQGFTLNERPGECTGVIPNESLRVLLAVSGDLRARLVDDGQKIELADEKGKGAMSYSRLVALDADGKKLPARMETSAEGHEIALVVEDAAARYPIVIDPFLTSLEQKLRSDIPQADARFGTAVAIDGNLAVVGAWREDVGANADVGAVYVFVRTGAYPNSSWALDKRFGSASGAGQQCGMSVAINANRIAYGCPGDNGGKGTAFYFQRNGANSYTGAVVGPGGFTAGDAFGSSIAINGDIVLVGAPGEPYNSEQNAGAAWISKINADGSTTVLVLQTEDVANQRLGTAVALDSTFPNEYTAIIGKPGALTGAVLIFEFDSQGFPIHTVTVTPPAGHSGDQFGQSVALSGHPGANTAVIGAWADDAKGTDAGAAYVFERVQSTLNWNFQQKLTASDGNTNNFFSLSAVAIQDNTIVVGAYAWDGGTPPFILNDDDRGAAYVFSRNGTVWTQQSEILAGDGQRGDNFGISVGVSGDTAIIGARHATAISTAAAGAAYVYRLPHRLGNISTRLRVESGDNALIGGFIVTGTQNKRVIVRAIGPSLTLADKLANPTLELYQGNNKIASNDNWVDSADKQAIIDSGVAPTDNLESAIIMSLPANNAQYTAIVRGADGGTGTAVVQVYDLDNSANSQLANISTRGYVQTGDNVLFAGTIVVGATPQKVIIRALGPSVPVVGRMSDPTLDLYDGNGTLLESNDNWVDSSNKQAIKDSGIPPNHDLESAIVRTLPLGTYTAIVRSFDGTPGIGVVEVYVLN
jgi:hypothetical protein